MYGVDGPGMTTSGSAPVSGQSHRCRTALRRLPVRVAWFSEGLFVVRATAEASGVVGCRVTAIGGHPPTSARDRVARLFAGNPSWVAYKSPLFLTSPEILVGTGLAADMEAIPFGFDCGNREHETVVLRPLPLVRTSTPTEPWHDLLPEPEEGWVGVPLRRVPTYLQRGTTPYSAEPLQRGRTLYVSYRRSQDVPEGADVAAFTEEILAALNAGGIRHVVVDLRFNTGGDLELAAPLMQDLADRRHDGRLRDLTVITGRATFSAGISAAAQLAVYGEARIVGEPVGDELDTWSEGGNLVLPHSGLTVHFTNGFHSLSPAPVGDRAPHVWTDLAVEDLDPDVAVPVHWRDYVAGRDRALTHALR